MKRLLILTGAMLALTASVAFAQLDLTWGNCVGEPGSSSLINLNCANTKSVKLFGCFKVPNPVPNFAAVDIDVDLQVDAPTLDNFWHFEGGGCNNAALSMFVNDDVSTNCNVNTQFNNPWDGIGGPGTNGSPFITAYGPGFGGANKGRLLMAIITNGGVSPLDPGKNWYMFHLSLTTALRATCAGCAQKVGINWNSATLFSDPPENPTVLLGGNVRVDKVSPCVHVNGIPTVACNVAAATRRTSWGQLKSLYR